jgi:hypothetical protein
VQYRDGDDSTIVERMKLPLSLSVAGPSARKHAPALTVAAVELTKLSATLVKAGADRSHDWDRDRCWDWCW